ncbi:MAG: HDIG domain-containing metalloprotein [Velocimicrobium sp.]
MKTHEKKREFYRLFWGVILIASSFSALFFIQSTSMEVLMIAKMYMITIILIAAFHGIISTNQMTFFKEKRIVYDLSIGYILSSAILCMDIKVPIYLLWILGSIYIAKKVHPLVGIFFHFIFTFLLCNIKAYGVEEFMYNFIIGCILCLLVSFADTLISLFYVLIITGSIEVILMFLKYSFIVNKVVYSHSLYKIVTIYLVVIISYFFHANKVEQSSDEVTKIEQTQPEATQVITIPTIESYDYTTLITSDAPLMKRLHEEKPMIYRHSLLIGILAEKAAIKIGVNEVLAKAGGLYHEIGRLESGDYLANGIRIAKEQKLPLLLIKIIQQQNGKLEKPTSKEAAILMLTDSIVTTIKYFEKQPENVKRSHDKIIEDIFRIRFEQGMLEESLLSLAEYQQLKEFYHINLPK